MGEQKQPQGKPLTAEELLKIIIDDFYKDVPKGMRTDFQMLPDDPKRLIAAEAMRKYAAQETAALREELDLYKGYDKERVKVINAFGQEKLRRLELEKELEAVKKELQGMKDDYHDIDEDGNHIGYGYWKDEYFRMQESARKYLKQRDEVTRQRDEAVKELEYARIIMPFHTGPEYKKWHEEFDKTISRLSSGETKQVETYQIYHYLDFENPPNPEENVLWYRVGEPPYSGSMLDTDFPGLDYFYAWTLIPAPPETSK